MTPQKGLAILKEKNPEWWSDIRDICCATGNAGSPIDKVRWSFFAEQWVGPYQRTLPEWTYVVMLGENVVGYLTGCPRTPRFNFLKKIIFDFPLLVKILFGVFGRNSDTHRFVRRFFCLDKSPEDSFHKKTLRYVHKNYPAHLHMNLLSNARGLGAGRELIHSFSKDLKDQGISGIHLYCGEEARRFYLKMGFADLAQIEFRPQVNVYLMGLLIN